MLISLFIREFSGNYREFIGNYREFRRYSRGIYRVFRGNLQGIYQKAGMERFNATDFSVQQAVLGICCKFKVKFLFILFNLFLEQDFLFNNF
jgi:hypothetical protein